MTDNQTAATPDDASADKPLGEMTREELNARAAASGVRAPEKLANKQEVVAAIESARSGDADGQSDADDQGDGVPPYEDPPPTPPADRMETFEATRPSGERVQVTRNVETGETYVASVGVPMLPGDPREPVGPEDALGAGPTRGDYRGRIGDASYQPHTVVAVPDAGPDEPRTRVVAQRSNAERIGDVAGEKGGVTTNAVQGA